MVRFVGSGNARVARPRPFVRLALIAALGLAACGGGNNSGQVSTAPGPSISMIVVNQMPIPAPCFGDSLTFFEGSTPVNIPNQSQKMVQVSQLFGAYEIGFQVNGWYWRTCTAPGNCPNPNNCQNPDNAGQVAVEIAADCSTAVLVKNFSDFTCDSLVPNASQAVSVTLQTSNPCTVVVAPTSTMLTPTDQCCSCSSCTGSEIPAGQVPHCQ